MFPLTHVVGPEKISSTNNVRDHLIKIWFTFFCDIEDKFIQFRDKERIWLLQMSFWSDLIVRNPFTLLHSTGDKLQVFPILTMLIQLQVLYFWATFTQSLSFGLEASRSCGMVPGWTPTSEYHLVITWPSYKHSSVIEPGGAKAIHVFNSTTLTTISMIGLYYSGCDLVLFCMSR